MFLKIQRFFFMKNPLKTSANKWVENAPVGKDHGINIVIRDFTDRLFARTVIMRNYESL